MIGNPEFRRNVWLELTSHRLIVMPAVLLLLFPTVYLTTSIGEGGPYRATAGAALFVFGGLMLWGLQLASNCILSEVAAHTWDTQRMSPISPWSMTWGKLFGSSVYTWYGGAICLTVYLCTPHGAFAERALNAAILVVGGVWLQALGLATTLQAVRKSPTTTRAPSGVLVLALGAIALFPMVAALFDPAARTMTIDWYALETPAFGFWLGSLLVFTAWTILGAYRLMRAELQLRNAPWVWVAFASFLLFYAAGFVAFPVSVSALPQQLMLAYLLGMALVYGMALTEPKELIGFRRFVQRARSGSWRRFSEEVPCWLATIPLVFVVGIARLLNPEATGQPTGHFFVAAFLFMLRDVGLLIGFNLSGSSKRADLAALFYLALLYLLAPWILHTLGGWPLLGLCWPMPDGTLLTTTLPVAVQLALVGGWVVRRWRRAFQAMPATAP